MATTNNNPPANGTPPQTADEPVMKKTLNGSDTPKRSDIPLATKSVALKVACKDLGKFLNSIPNFQNAHMLRKGREVHKIYVDVHKGSQFLEDEFSITEFGQMVLQNGSQSRVGRAKNAYSIVVARETLYCSGSGMCRRTCGGFGECVVGCTDTKVRGHKCSFRVKLTMRLAHVNYWWVEVQGRHNRPNSEDLDSTKATEEIIANISSTSNTISELLQESSSPNNGTSSNKHSSKRYSPSGLHVTSTPNDSITLPHMLDLSEEYSPSQSAFPGLPDTSRNTGSPMNRPLVQSKLGRKNSITHTQNILLNIPQTVKTLEVQKKLIPDTRDSASRFRLPVKIKVEPPDEYLAAAPFVMTSNASNNMNNSAGFTANSLAHISLAGPTVLQNGTTMVNDCTEPELSSNNTYAVDLTSRDVPNYMGSIQQSISAAGVNTSQSNPEQNQTQSSASSQPAPRSRKRKPLMTTRKVPTIYQNNVESSILTDGYSLVEDTGNKNKADVDVGSHISNSAERFVDGKDLVSRVKQLETHVQQLRNIVMKGQQSDAASKKKKNQREFDFSKHNTRHVALKIAYLGWDYHGFAVQEDTDKTIETAIFDALTRTKLIECREKSNYHRCGRTDKGVSAFAQVISIDLRTNLSDGVGVKVREGSTVASEQDEKKSEIRYAFILNKVLPPEIRVLAWAPVDESFSARFSCKKRMYKYFFPAAGFDIERMKEASQKLIGENDYRNFCKMDVANGVVNFTRKIYSVDIESMGERENGYQMYELTVIGQAFLWHQIRCIVALLFLIGEGKENPEVVDVLLNVEENPRKPQYTMAHELPLVLYDCHFNDELEWNFEADWHEENIKHLQNLWAQHQVKATIIKKMLDDLEKAKVETESDIAPWNELSTPIKTQADWMTPGNKPRIYKPLLERPKCESLEDRIEHYTRKRKLTEADSNETVGEDEGKKQKTVEAEGT